MVDYSGGLSNDIGSPWMDRMQELQNCFVRPKVGETITKPLSIRTSTIGFATPTDNLIFINNFAQASALVLWNPEKV